MGGSTSAEGGGISRSQVYGKQEPFLFNLYKQGQNLYDQQKFQTGDTQDKLRSLLGEVADVPTGTPGEASDFAKNLLSGDTQGMQSLLGMMNPQQNPYLDQMVQSASRGLIQNYGENVLPGIQGQATAAGHYGSSRQGIAEGIAARGLTDSLSDISTGLYGGQYQSDMNRALSAAGQYTGGQQAGAGILSSLSGQEFGQRMNQLSTLLGGHAQLPQVPWAPLAAYSNVVGAPATTQESINRNQSSGWNVL